ncbi:MAG: hypothetical protein V1742_00595 [Pseudomonadota bacterium]
MSACHIHQGRNVRVNCLKINTRGYCQECLDQGVPCFDPNVYCKFRGQCVILELARLHGLHRHEEPAVQAAG